MAKTPPQRRSRTKKTSPRRSSTRRRELNEDLHRYHAEIAEARSLLGAKAKKDRATSRMTRLQKREVIGRRAAHLLQFVLLLAVLLGLVAWLLHSSSLYL